MTKKSEIGMIGEEMACEYLKNKGYQILIRNYAKKFGEIDIIAKANDSTLIFIEVKTLLVKKGGLNPEDNFTTQKYNNVKRMCEFFVAKYPGAVNEEFGWRLDLIAVDFKEDGEFSIRHYENI